MTHPLDTYRDEFPWPPLDPLAFECLGRYGYGNGRVLSANAQGPHANTDVSFYPPDGRRTIKIIGGCDACAHHAECWQDTRVKAREVLPDLGQLETEITDAGFVGPAWMDEWCRRTDQTGGQENFIPPPAMVLMVENLHHGVWHTEGERFTGQHPEEGTQIR